MELPNFKYTPKQPNLEVIFENLAQVNFHIKDDYITTNDLTESVIKITENLMCFNLNWIPTQSNIIPLDKILKLINKKIEVEILFHDKNGFVIYKNILHGFVFEKITNLRNCDYYKNNEIKNLIVQYNFDEEEIIFK